jgi:hypothetical protein
MIGFTLLGSLGRQISLQLSGNSVSVSLDVVLP